MCQIYLLNLKRTPFLMTALNAVKEPFDRDRQFSSKRKSVILAAAMAFRRQGYHNTNMAQIAEALDLTRPALYYYVKNKEEILYESLSLIHI